MNKKRFSVLRLFLMMIVVVLLAVTGMMAVKVLREPSEVRTLKKQETAQTDEGHQEYYFGLLNEDEQRGYRAHWGCTPWRENKETKFVLKVL